MFLGEDLSQNSACEGVFLACVLAGRNRLFAIELVMRIKTLRRVINVVAASLGDSIDGASNE
jgi:hypothetical protein